MSRSDSSRTKDLKPVLYDDEEGNAKIGWASPGLTNFLRRKFEQNPEVFRKVEPKTEEDHESV